SPEFSSPCPVSTSDFSTRHLARQVPRGRYVSHPHQETAPCLPPLLPCRTLPTGPSTGSPGWRTPSRRVTTRALSLPSGHRRGWACAYGMDVPSPERRPPVPPDPPPTPDAGTAVLRPLAALLLRLAESRRQRIEPAAGQPPSGERPVADGATTAARPARI